ncbi:uncharacterized protein [Lepeophtheirus salmonis]|uniref:uncharacterized protein n=1 Tax=Lepeophtheirus salmonis TaxID=72036 RepID=UPI001AE326B2|nr:mucin-5AC-like [Lepeophtheirus salmonis]
MTVGSQMVFDSTIGKQDEVLSFSTSSTTKSFPTYATNVVANNSNGNMEQKNNFSLTTPIMEGVSNIAIPSTTSILHNSSSLFLNGDFSIPTRERNISLITTTSLTPESSTKIITNGAHELIMTSKTTFDQLNNNSGLSSTTKEYHGSSPKFPSSESPSESSRETTPLKFTETPVLSNIGNESTTTDFLVGETNGHTDFFSNGTKSSPAFDINQSTLTSLASSSTYQVKNDSSISNIFHASTTPTIAHNSSSLFLDQDHIIPTRNPTGVTPLLSLVDSEIPILSNMSHLSQNSSSLNESQHIISETTINESSLTTPQSNDFQNKTTNINNSSIVILGQESHGSSTISPHSDLHITILLNITTPSSKANITMDNLDETLSTTKKPNNDEMRVSASTIIKETSVTISAGKDTMTTPFFTPSINLSSTPTLESISMTTIHLFGNDTTPTTGPKVTSTVIKASTTTAPTTTVAPTTTTTTTTVSSISSSTTSSTITTAPTTIPVSTTASTTTTVSTTTIASTISITTTIVSTTFSTTTSSTITTATTTMPVSTTAPTTTPVSTTAPTTTRVSTTAPTTTPVSTTTSTMLLVSTTTTVSSITFSTASSTTIIVSTSTSTTTTVSPTSTTTTTTTFKFTFIQIIPHRSGTKSKNDSLPYSKYSPFLKYSPQRSMNRRHNSKQPQLWG